jgi:hypothetical protein
MRHIAVVNTSKLVSVSDEVSMTIACAKQAREHAAPAWGIPVPAVSFAADEAHVMPGAEKIFIFDDSDVAGALGYHDVTPMGDPYARVFVRDTLDNGGSVLSGASSVAVTLSHEMLEMLWDPDCDLYRPAPDSYEYAQEACDAVEADAYEVIPGVWGSNFVLDTFFDPAATGKRDYMGLVNSAFETRPGGYQIRQKDGVVTQVFGNHYPQHKLKGKTFPVARTARRIKCGS